MFAKHSTKLAHNQILYYLSGSLILINGKTRTSMSSPSKKDKEQGTGKFAFIYHPPRVLIPRTNRLKGGSGKRTVREDPAHTQKEVCAVAA
ncbi:hypothetical protein CEXT_325801 [Caerostris extrusa]|uniref:Uncharacterized protein n=1 Tax=Caerostris extrusa TaxID=172846 RepID=A0AAV4SBA8_CAEEX|nr:hypothetical protein CEXT_325801 [Caerostris extrusa]